MSGRIRQLKPELFFDEEFWALDEAHLELHLLRAFEGLWCHSDREGRFEWRPLMLRGKILPYWSGDFSRVLEVLRAAGYVQQYEVGGRYYGQVRSFHRHQRPNNREPESVIPEPPLEQTEGSLEHAQAGDSSVREPATFVCESPRASLPPLPTPDPNPYSQPRPTRASTGATALHRERKAPPSGPRAALVPENAVSGAAKAPRARLQRLDDVGAVQTPSRPGRVYTMPSEDPPLEYLDSAVMAGVSREQAASTWAHYWAAGLPEHGVEKLYPWLIKRARERASQTARVEPRAGPDDSLRKQADRVQMLREQEAEEERRRAAGVSS